MRIPVMTLWADARVGAFGMLAHALEATAVEVAPAAKPRQYADAGNGTSGAAPAWSPPI